MVSDLNLYRGNGEAGDYFFFSLLAEIERF